MKKYLFLVISLLVASVGFMSCDDDETYAEQKEREAKRIRKWIETHNIDVISISDFLKDTITNNPETGPDSTRNEYVLFADNGVYMQIVKRGGGQIMGPDALWYMNAEYVEIYVGTGDTMTLNHFQHEPDKFYIQRTGGNYTASFLSGVMSSVYGSTVPSSWIMPFPYIKPGMLGSASKVRLIVPHNQGTQTAASNVYPTFYEITFTPQKFNGND